MCTYQMGDSPGPARPGTRRPRSRIRPSLPRNLDLRLEADARGNFVAVASDDGIVSVFDLEREERTPAAIASALRCSVAWHVVGDALVAGAAGGTACVPSS